MSQLGAYSGNICVELFRVMNVGLDSYRATLRQHEEVVNHYVNTEIRLPQWKH